MRYTILTICLGTLLAVQAAIAALTPGTEWPRRGYDLGQTHEYMYGAENPVALDSYSPYWSAADGGRAIRTADVVGCDGVLEVLVYDGQAVDIYSSSGSAISSFVISGHTGYSQPIVADVDGDGCGEIVCGSQGRVSIYDGAGTLMASFTGFSSVPYPIHAGDFDSDVSYELIIRNASNLISLDVTSGIRNWETALSTYGGRFCAVGDVNGDGILDAVPDSRSGGGSSTQAVSLDDGGFILNISYGAGLTSHSISTLGQGTELGYTCLQGRLPYEAEPMRAISYDAAGNVVASWEGPVGRDVANWAISNFDSDPAGELAVCTYANGSNNTDFTLYLVDDDLGTILAMNNTLVNSTNNAVSMYSADLTGDGNLEILVTDYNSGILWVLDSDLEPLWSHPCPGIRDLAIGDLDGDGLSEVILGGESIIVLSVETIIVNADIKPDSCPNPLNVKAKGHTSSARIASESGHDPIRDAMYNGRRGPVLPVAILGNENFDVTEIDPTTVILESLPALRWSYEDVATPMSADATLCECNDIGGDGLTDLTLKFDRTTLIERLGEVYDGEEIPLTVSGQLVDGTPFEGADCVLIRGHRDRPGADEPLARLSSAVPDEFGLHQNYPNPFNPATEISFSLPTASDVTLTIYNMLGQTVGVLADEYMNAGHHTVAWDGSQVASNVYFYRLTTEEFTDTKKMMLLK